MEGEAVFRIRGRNATGNAVGSNQRLKKQEGVDTDTVQFCRCQNQGKTAGSDRRKRLLEGHDRIPMTDGGKAQNVVLEADGVEISVSDGEQIGTRLRNIAFLNGSTKQRAQEIHREHVQFYVQDASWVVEAIGTNPTVLNGEELSKGETVEIADGDTLELSGVLETEIKIE